MNASNPWGKSAAINLSECDHEKLVDPELIKKFIAEIIKVIAMEAHGPCYIDRFGEGDIEGWSAMQFIKTSNITIHCDEVGNRAFIDIFTCKDFDAQVAEQFTRNFFGAKGSKMTVLER